MGGIQKWASLYSHIDVDSESGDKIIRSVWKDITALKMVEKELSEKSFFLDNILGHILDLGLIVTDSFSVSSWPIRPPGKSWLTRSRNYPGKALWIFSFAIKSIRPESKKKPSWAFGRGRASFHHSQEDQRQDTHHGVTDAGHAR